MPQEEFERNQEMWKLRYVYGWSNTKIGNKYGITRERVRQVIGNTGSMFRRKWTENLKNSGKIDTSHIHHSEIDAVLPGIKAVWKEGWSAERHIAKSGFLKVSQEFEERAIQILYANGIMGQIMPSRHPYSILTDSGIRVDVRVTNTDVSKFKTQNCVYPTYQVPNLDSWNECDFFFIFVPEGIDYTYFVIPSHEVSGMAKSSRIRIPWPKIGKKDSKWHKFHQKIDFLL